MMGLFCYLWVIFRRYIKYIVHSEKPFKLFVNNKCVGENLTKYTFGKGDTVRAEGDGTVYFEEESFFSEQTPIQNWIEKVKNDLDLTEKDKRFLLRFSEIFFQITQKAIAASYPKYPKGAIVVSQDQESLEVIVDKEGNRRPYPEVKSINKKVVKGEINDEFRKELENAIRKAENSSQF